MPSPDSDTPYAALTLAALPRAMGLQDDAPASRTFGCCDRGYWHYKTLVDFPAATMQQLALPFAILYAVDLPGNEHHGKAAMLDRAGSAMRFWCDIQHRGGAFDEWYRNEFSYCATAFTTAAMGQSLILLKDALDEATRQRVLDGISRANRWLAERFNPHVMNQNLAACVALWCAHELAPQDRLREALEAKWTRTLEHFSNEGWFREYDGPDCGYTTLALDLLAVLDRDDAPVEVRSAAEKMCRFLRLCCVRTGAPAARLGSRGTAHAFPFGVEHFAPDLPDAAAVAMPFRREYAAGRLITPADADDRYLAYFYLPQFALAATLDPARGLAAPSDALPETFCSEREEIIVWRRDDADVVIAPQRNGALNLHLVDAAPRHVLGWIVETARGERWTSCGGRSDRCGSVEVDHSTENVLIVRGWFSLIDDDLPLRRHAVAFHMLNRWLLRFQPIAERFSAWLKRRKIRTRSVGPLKIERRIAWSEEGLTITDTLIAQPRSPRFTAILPAEDVTVHSPSARLRAARTAASPAAASAAERLNADGRIELVTVCRVGPSSRADA